MISSILTAITQVKKYLLIILIVGVALVSGYLMYGCGKKSADDKVAQLTTQLAQNETTIETKDGLYATKVIETTNLKNLLDGTQKEVQELEASLKDSQAELLSTQQLVVKWKKAYEGAVSASQTDVPPGPGTTGTTRKRVDFTGDLGPIHVTGNTLTDPPEAYLKLEQVRPLKLTVSVAKNKDGTWSSYVTSSDPSMDVKVNLGAVDIGILSPAWYQRIWFDLGADFLGDKRATVGLSYHLDRYSVGASCSAWTGGDGCGLTFGYRLFK